MKDTEKWLRQVSLDAKEYLEKSTPLDTSALEQHLRQEAGQLYEVITSSREQAIKHLQHPDISVRKAALSLFPSTWTADTSVEKVCEQFALEGPEPLQAQAISILALIKNDLYGERVSEIMAKYALDPNIPVAVRREVYFQIQSSFDSIEQRLASAKMYREMSIEDAENVEINPKIIQQCVEWERLHYPAPRT